MKKVVLFTGSRDYRNIDKVIEVLETYDPSTTVLVHGGAKGLDTLVDIAGRMMGFDIKVYKADWIKGDNREGLYRNSQMLHESQPDEVVGFRSKLNSRGTNDMLKKAGQAGISHKIYDDWRE